MTATPDSGPGSWWGTLGTRIAVYMLLAAVVPLGLASWTAYRLSQDAVAERTAELHRRAAKALALVVSQDLDRRVRAVQDAAAAVRFASLDDEARLGALRLAFRQIDGASVVVLLDGSGQQATEPVFLRRPAREAALVNRPPVSPADLEAFARRIPHSAALELGAGLGLPYTAASGAPRIAVAARTGDAQVLAVELDLEHLVSEVARSQIGDGGLSFVVDEDGRVVLDRDPRAIAIAENRSRWPLVAAAISQLPAPPRFDHPRLGRSLGATSPLPLFGWTAVVLEPEEQALAAARSLAFDQFLWLGVAIAVALLLGFSLSRVIGRPIAELHRGARVLGGGDFSHRVAGAGRSDELGDLARSFNSMAVEIQQWNLEMEKRVEEKATELAEMQALLARTERMAAVGELGAGVAHEIKNPLTSLMGMVHMILEQKEGAPEVLRRVGVIQEQAKRINAIVDNLRRLTEATTGAGLLPTSLERHIVRALKDTEERREAQSVKLERQGSSDGVKVSSRGDELVDAFRRIVENALDAMPEGGTLSVSVEIPETRLVAIRFQDTGKGIPERLRHRVFEPFFTTRRDRKAKGLGLTLVHQAIDTHNGRVKIDSHDGSGVTVTVLLPTPMERSLA